MKRYQLCAAILALGLSTAPAQAVPSTGISDIGTSVSQTRTDPPCNYIRVNCPHK